MGHVTMMDNKELLSQIYTAEGPDGLIKQLINLLDRAQSDPGFAVKEHYIMYQLNTQKSLIKVDMSQTPFQFWYYDLQGRPATEIVKDTIALFLSEKYGQKEKIGHYFHDVGKEELLRNQADFIRGGEWASYDVKDQSVFHAIDLLTLRKRTQIPAKQHWFSFFKPKGPEEESAIKPAMKNKIEGGKTFKR